MPIKFRCKHCHQLLGISRSRASAVVDCPQCGRSLRVPELDGRTRRLPNPESEVKRDSALLSALSELSVLGQDDQASAAERTEPAAEQGTEVAAPDVVLPEPLAMSEPVDVEITCDAAAPEADIEFDAPIPLVESLNELAAFEQQKPNGVVSIDVLRDMREVSRGPSSMTFPLLSGIAMLLLGIPVGWWVGQRSADVTGSVDATPDALPLPEMDVPIPVRPVGNGISIQGTIEYLAASGRTLPDSGAIALLLPVDRQGTIKLNARSLKQPAGNLDLAATVAALSALGGAVGLAEEDGSYQLTSPQDVDCILIVVSRHQERADDLAAPPQAVSVLEAWFDSTNHVLGRLAVKTVEISQQNLKGLPVDVQFNTAQ
ncbi:MAG: hypothetical protein GY903_17035 [Fuerstiella sp.]|nr:hypothetical protein [Fuerstiella sp.]MCP4856189.1 hypothetical protein [Fuerstiella sp.]